MLSEMGALYANALLRETAYLLAGLFVPVYLFTLGYPLPHIFLYLIIFYALLGVLSPATVLLQSKLGNKKTAIIGIAGDIVFYALIYLIKDLHDPLILLAIVNGFATSFYWVSINTLFATGSEKKRRGTQLAIWTATSNLVGIAAPILGAIGITSLGFNALAIAAGILFALSAIPLLITKDNKAGTGAWKEMRKSMAYFPFFLGEGAFFVVLEIWPLFVYLIKPDFMLVGLAAAVDQAALAAITIAVGRASDRFDRTLLIKIGAIAFAAVAAVAGYVTEVWQLVLFAFLLPSVQLFADLPFFALSCGAVRKDRMAQFMAVREIGVNVSRCLVLCAAVIFFANPFLAAFTASALFALLFIFFPRRLSKG
jgi:hypothetical protein